MAASIASDYAVMNVGNLTCYYGYEETDEAGNWCFYAQVHGTKEKHKIPVAKLGVKDQWNCGECLLAGIEKFFEDHEFHLPPF